jgi:nitrite reductase (NADH) large subunit
MARVAAARLANKDGIRFAHSDTPTRLKVTGIELFALGDFAEGGDREDIVLRDPSTGVYKRVVLRDDRIIGTVLLGETGSGGWFNELKQKRVDVSAMRDTLIFGRDYESMPPRDDGRCSLTV